MVQVEKINQIEIGKDYVYVGQDTLCIEEEEDEPL